MEFSNTNDVRGKRSFGSLTTGNNILHPYALFHQNEANNAFQNISDLHHGKYCQHMKPCKSAEAVRNGHTDAPHEHTVKQECNNGLAAGAQSEISRMEKCILRHKDGHDHNEIFRQLSCILIGLIKPWEKTAQPQASQSQLPYST